jgi:hypothetical protein
MRQAINVGRSILWAGLLRVAAADGPATAMPAIDVASYAIAALGGLVAVFGLGFGIYQAVNVCCLSGVRRAPSPSQMRDPVAGSPGSGSEDGYDALDSDGGDDVAPTNLLHEYMGRVAALEGVRI